MDHVHVADHCCFCLKCGPYHHNYPNYAPSLMPNQPIYQPPTTSTHLSSSSQPQLLAPPPYQQHYLGPIFYPPNVHIHQNAPLTLNQRRDLYRLSHKHSSSLSPRTPPSNRSPGRIRDARSQKHRKAHINPLISPSNIVTVEDDPNQSEKEEEQDEGSLRKRRPRGRRQRRQRRQREAFNRSGKGDTDKAFPPLIDLSKTPDDAALRTPSRHASRRVRTKAEEEQLETETQAVDAVYRKILGSDTPNQFFPPSMNETPTRVIIIDDDYGDDDSDGDSSSTSFSSPVTKPRRRLRRGRKSHRNAASSSSSPLHPENSSSSSSFSSLGQRPLSSLTSLLSASSELPHPVNLEKVRRKRRRYDDDDDDDSTDDDSDDESNFNEEFDSNDFAATHGFEEDIFNLTGFNDELEEDEDDEKDSSEVESQSSVDRAFTDALHEHYNRADAYSFDSDSYKEIDDAPIDISVPEFHNYENLNLRFRRHKNVLKVFNLKPAINAQHLQLFFNVYGPCRQVIFNKKRRKLEATIEFYKRSHARAAFEAWSRPPKELTIRKQAKDAFKAAKAILKRSRHAAEHGGSDDDDDDNQEEESSDLGEEPRLKLRPHLSLTSEAKLISANPLISGIAFIRDNRSGIDASSMFATWSSDRVVLSVLDPALQKQTMARIQIQSQFLTGDNVHGGDQGHHVTQCLFLPSNTIHDSWAMSASDEDALMIVITEQPAILLVSLALQVEIHRISLERYKPVVFSVVSNGTSSSPSLAILRRGHCSFFELVIWTFPHGKTVADMASGIARPDPCRIQKQVILKINGFSGQQLGEPISFSFSPDNKLVFVAFSTPTNATLIAWWSTDVSQVDVFNRPQGLLEDQAIPEELALGWAWSERVPSLKFFSFSSLSQSEELDNDYFGFIDLFRASHDRGGEDGGGLCWRQSLFNLPLTNARGYALQPIRVSAPHQAIHLESEFALSDDRSRFVIGTSEGDLLMYDFVHGSLLFFISQRVASPAMPAISLAIRDIYFEANSNDRVITSQGALIHLWRRPSKEEFTHKLILYFRSKLLREETRRFEEREFNRHFSRYKAKIKKEKEDND